MRASREPNARASLQDGAEDCSSVPNAAGLGPGPGLPEPAAIRVANVARPGHALLDVLTTLLALHRGCYTKGSRRCPPTATAPSPWPEGARRSWPGGRPPPAFETRVRGLLLRRPSSERQSEPRDHPGARVLRPAEPPGAAVRYIHGWRPRRRPAPEAARRSLPGGETRSSCGPGRPRSSRATGAVRGTTPARPRAACPRPSRSPSSPDRQTRRSARTRGRRGAGPILRRGVVTLW